MSSVTISGLVEESGKAAVLKGFSHRNFGDCVALIATEVGEAFDAYRVMGDFTTWYRDDGKPEGVPSELADIIIRVCDTAYRRGIDLEAAITEKLAFNKTRPYKHGKVL